LTAAGPGLLGEPLARLLAHPRLLAVLGAGCLAFSGILVRLSLASPSTATVFRALYALPFLIVLALPEERRLGPPAGRVRLLALGAGLFFAVDLTSFHLAIGEIGAGLATVMGNLQVIVVGVVAWLLLGERPSGRILLGAPVAVLGIVLISGVIGGGAYGRDPGLGVGYGIVTAFAYAGYLLLLRRARTPGRFVGPVRDATAATVVGGIVGGLLLGDLVLVPTWPGHGWLLLLAISAQVAGGLLIAASLPHLPAVVSSLILLSQPVAAVILAALLLGEAPSPYQVAGVGLVLAGVAIGTLPVGRIVGRQPAA
jgi:drug/metabolite transporter (DMT)-like permease